MICRIINLVARRQRKLPIFRWWWVDLLEIDFIIVIIDNQNDWKYVCAITGKGNNSEYSCIRIERLIVMVGGPLKAVVAAIDRNARSIHVNTHSPSPAITFELYCLLLTSPELGIVRLERRCWRWCWGRAESRRLFQRQLRAKQAPITGSVSMANYLDTGKHVSEGNKAARLIYLELEPARVPKKWRIGTADRVRARRSGNFLDQFDQLGPSPRSWPQPAVELWIWPSATEIPNIEDVPMYALHNVARQNSKRVSFPPRRR